MEYYVLNDIELSFKDVLKRSLGGEPLQDKEEMAEWEKKRGRHSNGNGNHVEKTRRNSGKSDISEEEQGEKKENGDASEQMDVDNKSLSKEDKEKSRLVKARAVEKASILAPQLNLQQIEAAIAKGGGVGYDQEMINDLMAQTYAASVRWPKDKVLMVRLQHIVQAIEENKWPVPENFTLLDLAVENGTDTPEPTPNPRDTGTPLSEVGFQINILKPLCLNIKTVLFFNLKGKFSQTKYLFRFLNCLRTTTETS